jgi:hypothetical protein
MTNLLCLYKNDHYGSFNPIIWTCKAYTSFLGLWTPQTAQLSDCSAIDVYYACARRLLPFTFP